MKIKKEQKVYVVRTWKGEKTIPSLFSFNRGNVGIRLRTFKTFDELWEFVNNKKLKVMNNISSPKNAKRLIISKIQSTDALIRCQQLFDDVKNINSIVRDWQIR